MQTFPRKRRAQNSHRLAVWVGQALAGLSWALADLRLLKPGEARGQEKVPETSIFLITRSTGSLGQSLWNVESGGLSGAGKAPRRTNRRPHILSSPDPNVALAQCDSCHANKPTFKVPCISINLNV